MQVPFPEEDLGPVCVLQLPAFQGRRESPSLSVTSWNTKQMGKWHLHRTVVWNCPKQPINSQLLALSLMRTWHRCYPSTPEPSPSLSPTRPPRSGAEGQFTGGRGPGVGEGLGLLCTKLSNKNINSLSKFPCTKWSCENSFIKETILMFLKSSTFCKGTWPLA